MENKKSCEQAIKSYEEKKRLKKLAGITNESSKGVNPKVLETVKAFENLVEYFKDLKKC